MLKLIDLGWTAFGKGCTALGDSCTAFGKGCSALLCRIVVTTSAVSCAFENFRVDIHLCKLRDE